MPDQLRRTLPPGVPRLAPDPGYSVQDWSGQKLLKCHDCLFDTFSLVNMQKHREQGCRPPDGEWDEEAGIPRALACADCDFQNPDPDLAANHVKLTGHHVI